MYPERIGRMILLNGSYGRTLQFAFQPVLRIPWLGDVIHDLINFVRLNMCDYYKSLANWMIRHKKWLMRVMRPYGLVYNQVDCEKFLCFYLIDILNNSRNHTDSYFRALQFLDAHSSEHLLHEITTPTLIITGMLDYLTPAYLSFEMHRQMQNSKLICHNLCTHFALLEKPQKIGKEIADYICDDNVTYSSWYNDYISSNQHKNNNKDDDNDDDKPQYNRERQRRSASRSPQVSPRNKPLSNQQTHDGSVKPDKHSYDDDTSGNDRLHHTLQLDNSSNGVIYDSSNNNVNSTIKPISSTILSSISNDYIHDSLNDSDISIYNTANKSVAESTPVSIQA